ncbi:MAG: alkaline phosphatase family protein [Promethearchaeota archaeon]
MNRYRVIFIGIDGATPKLIEEFFKEKKLPNLLLFQKEGILGNLQSSIPPLSPVAWTSMFCGVNPGKHGIYGFVKIQPGTDQMKPVTAHDRKAKAIWEILSRRGYKTIVINVPITYPPDPINGIMISGLGTPSISSNFMFPPSIRSSFLKEHPNYKIDFNEELFRLDGDKNSLLKRINLAQKIRWQIVTDYLKTKEWDLFIVVFRFLDVVQHFFWNERDILLKFYQKIDQILGLIINYLTDNITLMIASDHGFEEVKWQFHLNNWLEQQNYLKYLSIRPMGKFVGRIGLKPENIQKIMLKLGLRGIVWRIKHSKYTSHVLSQISPQRSIFNIDWEKTRAFYVPGSNHMIDINPYYSWESSDEKEHFITELLEKLRKIKDSNLNYRLMQDVFRKNVVYSGKHVDTLPEFVLIPNKGFELFGEEHLRGLFRKPKQAAVNRPASHNMTGIFGVFGSSIKPKRLNANLLDIAPSILNLLNTPIPKYFDGKSFIPKITKQ